MRKVLVLADGMFTKNDLFGPFAQRFDRFKKFDVVYDVADDTSGARFSSKRGEFILEKLKVLSERRARGKGPVKS